MVTESGTPIRTTRTSGLFATQFPSLTHPSTLDFQSCDLGLITCRLCASIFPVINADCLMKPLRDLLKHSSIYMIGQILTRMASVLLLPLYTHCLAPADYGAIAILDLTSALLSTLIAGGMIPAIVRHHFDSEDSKHHDRVWWTGLTFVTLTAAAVCLPMWFFRQVLAEITLGPEVTNGSWFYTLAACTIMVSAIGQTVDAYLRVRKW